MALIRPADVGDLAALTDLRHRWGTERGAAEDAGFADRFHDWFEMDSPRRRFWLAERDSDAIGMVHLLTFERMPTPGRDAGRWVYLGNMFVVADHRNRGVGRQLLDALLVHAESEGLVRVVLSPSDRSVPFYRRAGFGDAGELLVRRRRAVGASGHAAP